MDDRSIDWITDTLVATMAQGGATWPAVLFLLRRYADTGRDEVRNAVESGLARGLEAAAAERDPCERCQWLGLFAEAAAVSDDEQLVEAVQTSLAGAIDELEAWVRAEYESGEGLIGRSLWDHLRGASAFLTAFDLTGRLPYAMLAEELVLAARRRSWDEERGAFLDDFRTNAVAASVLCRLAALHRDPEYTASAVVARQATHLVDAERTLQSLAPIYREHPASAAEYGVALLDGFALTMHPN